MTKFVNIIPKCELCGGELALSAVHVDLVHCWYVLFCSCIVCGEEQIITLSLDDFIEINQLLGGPS